MKLKQAIAEFMPSHNKRITYAQFKEVENILSQDIAESEKAIKMFSVVFGIERDEFNRFGAYKVSKYNKELEGLLNPPKTLHKFFKWKGETFYFIPDFSNITTGELIDLENYFRAEDYVSLFNILYRPLDGKVRNGMYNVVKYDGTRYFDDLPYCVVLGGLDFFYQSYEILSQTTRIYSGKK